MHEGQILATFLESTVSHQTHPSKTPFLLAPQSKFQLLLHCWHLCPRAQEVSTMLLGQSTWTCDLLGQTLTRASLYLSLIPAAGIAVMPFIVFVPCLFFPALQSAGLLPGRSWPAANPSCSMRWVFPVGTYSVQKQRSFKGKKHSHWTKVAKKILWWLERNGCFRLLSLLCWLYQKYIPDCLTILALALLSCSACCLVSLIFIKWLFLKFMVCLAGKATFGTMTFSLLRITGWWLWALCCWFSNLLWFVGTPWALLHCCSVITCSFLKRQKLPRIKKV